MIAWLIARWFLKRLRFPLRQCRPIQWHVHRWCIIEFWPADLGHWVILSALLGIAAGVAWKLWQGKF